MPRGQSDPDLRAGPPPGTVQRHGHDEASVSMQAGEGADRLRLGTIDGKGLVATFREELADSTGGASAGVA